jgi:group I intron endonuclease
MYVGSSIDMYKRIKRYLTLKHLHGVIGKALLKDGLFSFVLVVFLFPNATKEVVLSLEQSVLYGCTCAYNVLPTAGSHASLVAYAGAKRSEESKSRLSESRKGIKLSEEHKANISLAQRGKKAPDIILVNRYISILYMRTPWT